MKMIDMTDLRGVYDYQMKLAVPYFVPVDFECWKESFENDAAAREERCSKPCSVRRPVRANESWALFSTDALPLVSMNVVRSLLMCPIR